MIERLFAALWRSIERWPEPDRWVGLAVLLVVYGIFSIDDEGPTHE